MVMEVAVTAGLSLSEVRSLTAEEFDILVRVLESRRER
jgi:hypothetical protein